MPALERTAEILWCGVTHNGDGNEKKKKKNGKPCFTDVIHDRVPSPHLSQAAGQAGGGLDAQESTEILKGLSSQE